MVCKLFGLVSESVLTFSAFRGFGMHIWDSTLPDVILSLKYFWVSICVGVLGICFAKSAVIALLLGVRGPNQHKRAYFLHFLWISNFVLSILLITLIYTQCNPQDQIWNPTETNAKCDLRPQTVIVGYLQGAWAAMTDVVLALYPIMIVWDLQTSRKMKLGFCILMSGGIM